MFVYDKCPSSEKMAEVTVVPVSSSAINYSNEIRLQELNIITVFVIQCVKGFMRSSYGRVLNEIFYRMTEGYRTFATEAACFGAGVRRYGQRHCSDVSATFYRF
jgi:hypothetical protein